MHQMLRMRLYGDRTSAANSNNSEGLVLRWLVGVQQHVNGSSRDFLKLIHLTDQEEHFTYLMKSSSMMRCFLLQPVYCIES